ncbi:MAG: GTPase [Comamonadaceae bacterium]|nr:MAG: GTPase [Comamonadaceae bacterium]
MPRIAFMGPMGVGKTTAIRALCGDEMAASDVPNLDRQSHVKEFTTVGAEFGEIDLGKGERVQVCGCPGQDRFDFLRQWVISVSVAVFVMVDANANDAVQTTGALLAEAAQAERPPLALVLSTRPASPAQMEVFVAGLQAAGHGVVPVLQVDVRKRSDVLQALGVLVSMLSLQSESP